MLYAYVLGNDAKIYEVNNQPLFTLIRECALPENSIYMDDMGNTVRPELELLKNTVVSGDTVMVRSLLDIADTPDKVINLLQLFGDNGVEVVSTAEPYYDYVKNFQIISDTVRICAELAEKKRRLGIDRATTEGRMGRKINQEVVDRITRLRSAGFSVEEITKICSISRSTYYRYAKK